MTNRIKTHRLPVYAELNEPEPVPQNAPLLDTESQFNFWLLALGAIATIGFIAWGFGLFKTPSQALTDRNQKLEQQLQSKTTELNRLNACFGGGK